MTAEGQPMHRVLLVEDDPVSRAFLSAALEGVCEVDSADGVAAALALARSQAYDAWLLDAHLPDGSGTDLLARLRSDKPRTPALAHTAAGDDGLHLALREAGFADVLVKPLPATAVRAAIGRLLGFASSDNAASGADAVPGLPVWDDAAAARALNGNLAHVRTLRGLFLQELAHIAHDVGDAYRRDDKAHVRQTLHKLRASCGFVGAQRLAHAVRALEAHDADARALEAFDAAIAATLQAAPSPQDAFSHARD